MLTEFLRSGQVGNIELNAQKQIRESVTKRWEQLGFVDGLEGQLKENVATLYENEAKHLLTEATDADNSGSFETVVFPIIRRVFSKLLANDIVSVQAMNLPVGKLFFILPVTSDRDWENLDANGNMQDGTTGSHKGLMGYDRINRNKQGAKDPRYYLPDEVVNGLVKGSYYIVPEGTGTTYADQVDATTGALTGKTGYQLAIAAITTGALKDKGYTAADVRGVGPEVTQYIQKSLYDLFYNDFLYDNSKGKITIKAGGANAVTLTPAGFTDFTGTTLATYPQNGLDSTVRNIILEVTGFNSYNASKITGPDGNEMDTEAFLASMKVVSTNAIKAGTAGATSAATTSFEALEGIPFRVVTQKYGKGIVEYGNPCDATGKMYIELDLAKPTIEQGKTIDGYIGVDPAKLTGKPDEMFKIFWSQYDSLELETEIGEVSFKLDSVTVSVEERKLRATWSPELAQDVSAFHNIDAEAELTAILSEQIAAEIDREILRDLRKSAPWQARWDVNGWRRMAAFSTNYTQKDWNQELMTKINQVSAQIHKSTLRGGANFIVVSSEISALFDNLEYFHVSDASAEQDQYNMGIERIGALEGRYQVYRDPYSPAWSMIIGHKGKSLLDTGYIYAPYVPMQLTPTMFNPFNMAPVKGIMTRFAKKMVNNRYYGHVRVDGLVTWNINELR
jgi:hypothetical protein